MKKAILIFLCYLTIQSVQAQWTTIASTNDIKNTNTGNVGIGTSSPGYKLDVAGLVNIDPGVASTNPILRLRVNNGYGTFNADASSDLHWNGRFHVDQTFFPDGGMAFNSFGAGIALNSGPITGILSLAFNHAGSNIKMYCDYGVYSAPADQGIIVKYGGKTTGYYPQAVYQAYKDGDPTENPFLISANGFGWLKNSKTDEVAWIVKAAASQTADIQQWQDGSGTALVKVTSAGRVGIGTTTPNSNAKLDVNGNIFSNGKIAIGTTDITQIGTYSLAVNGDAIFDKVKVKAYPWADYVFNNNYPLLPLKELEKFIQDHKHLPEVPSAAEVEKEGLDVGDNQALLLKKIEELTLYIIDQDKRIKRLEEALKNK
jgi:hypothetical protein